MDREHMVEDPTPPPPKPAVYLKSNHRIFADVGLDGTIHYDWALTRHIADLPLTTVVGGQLRDLPGQESVIRGFARLLVGALELGKRLGADAERARMDPDGLGTAA